MKKTLFFFMAIAVMGAVFAQTENVEIKYNTQVVNQGDTVTLNISSPCDEVSFPLSFLNQESDSLRVFVYAGTSSATSSLTHLTGMCSDGSCQVGDRTNYFALAPSTLFNDFHANFEIDRGMSVGDASLYNFALKLNDSTTIKSFTLKLVVGSVAINEAVANNSLNVYPNPATNRITVNYTINEANTKIQIVNMLGSVVEEIAIDANSGSKNISTEKLVSGIYACKIVSGNKTLCTKKLIIK